MVEKKHEIVLVHPKVTVICPPLFPSGRKWFCYLWEHDDVWVWSGHWTSWISYERQCLWVRGGSSRHMHFWNSPWWSGLCSTLQWKGAEYFLSVSSRLEFQCRYSGTAVEALVVEVNTVPPPPPVSQQGPLRVELRLAKGQCATKGCSDGKQNPETTI